MLKVDRDLDGRQTIEILAELFNLFSNARLRFGVEMTVPSRNRYLH